MVDVQQREGHGRLVVEAPECGEVRGVVADQYDLPWERVAAETRWGAYVNAIETDVVARGTAAATGPPTVLDVGCEGGRWSQPLANDGWLITGTDVSEEAVAAFRQRLPNATCLLVEPGTTELPAPTGSIGLLLCLEVFAVVHEDWFLDEVARVLAPGGVVVAVVSNRNSYRRYLWRAARRHGPSTSDDALPMYSRSYRSWRQRLEQAGFRRVYERGACWLPFSRRSNSSLIPPLSKLELILGLRRMTSISPWICVAMQRR
jgi:SAM-dependent methyltransferase